MKELIKRMKSPVIWIALLGLIYSSFILPKYPEFPAWTAIVGYVATIFGVANNPCDKKHF